MSGNVTLAVVVGVLFATGVYLVLERSLTRVLLGTVLMGNGANLLILMAGGAAGGPPLVGVTDEAEMSDPLPQAMILTAIVITLGMTAFLLAMAFRSWQLRSESTRLNSSHVAISYAVFCLNTKIRNRTRG